MKSRIIMRRFLNYLNTLIVFAALACFPLVLTITYQFDKETSNKLDQINELFLKIDESNQKQIMLLNLKVNQLFNTIMRTLL